MIDPDIQIKRRKRSKKCCKAPGIAKPKRYNNCPSQMREVSMSKCGSKSRRRRKRRKKKKEFPYGRGCESFDWDSGKAPGCKVCPDMPGCNWQEQEKWRESEDEDIAVKDVTKIGRDSANTAENRRKYFRPEEDDDDFIVKDVTKIGRDSANTTENRRKYFRPEEDDDEIHVKTINKEYYGRKSRKKRRRKSRKNTKKAVKNNKKKKTKKKTKKSSRKKRKRRKRTRK